jgi:hypothetical protein
MIMLKKIVVICASLLLLLSSGSAKADTIDFGLSTWAPANNQPYYTDNTSFDYSITLTPLTEPPIPEQDMKLSWELGDGIGVNNYGDWDELDKEWDPVNEVWQKEWLVISFGTTFRLESFTVSDLFYEGGVYEAGKFRTYDINGWSNYQLFTADNTTLPGGFHTVTLNNTRDITKIQFKAINSTGNFQDHDFSVASITGDAVPEPGTMLLFGSAAGLVGFIRRYRRKKSA